MNIIPKGIIPPIITTFDQKEQANYHTLKKR